MLLSIYPEYEWLSWRFTQIPKNFWEKMENQKKFVDWAGKKLGIKEMDDWYKILREVEISENFLKK
jgi:hypothetical protein